MSAHTTLCREHGCVQVDVENFPSAAPGQFVQVLCRDPDDEPGVGEAYLRRPLSIGGLRRDGERARIDLLYRVVGRGTRWLSHRRPGDPVSLLGPLGRPFAIEPSRPVAYLVGGGIGLPPLIWLAQVLHDAGRRVTAFCGARTADLLPLTRREGVAVSGDEGSSAFDEFAGAGVPVLVATDDGSLGAMGLIPDIFAGYLDRHSADTASAVVYTCGPNPMMAATARVARDRSMRCQVSLERLMACGMGTCQSCVVRVRDDRADHGERYRLCCTDGPVFDSRDVLWDS